jgi:hypothetical protein
LSQLIGGLRDRLGADHPRFRSERAKTVVQHLRLILGLLAPGGCAILVNDVLSSDTVPRLRQVPEDDLPRLMQQLVLEGKTFGCMDPGAMGSALDRLSFAGSRRWSAPWLWDLSPSRSYLVYGLVLGAGLVPLRGDR